MLWCLPGAVAKPRVLLAQAPAAPPTALILAVRGNALTLSVGTEDGAQIGQTYRVTQGNRSVTIQIAAVTSNQSTAMMIGAPDDFVITVGETATFSGQAPLAPSAPPAPAAPVLPAPAPLDNAATAGVPRQAIITAINGTIVTLLIGADDGAVLGAVYALPLEGRIRARVQITSVTRTSAQATMISMEEGFLPTVGDVARFIGVQVAPVAPAPVAPTPLPPLSPSATPVPSFPAPSGSPVSGAPISGSPVDATGIRVAPAPVASLSGSTATVTAIEGQSVLISAGSAQGAQTGMNVPILRGGMVIGLLRLQVVSDNTSTGVVVFRDETLAAISPGDAVGILGAPPSVGAPAVGTVPVANAPVVATPIKYETGVSNAAVPKADRTYELLAALASSGLIRSQPPSVFQDEGARRHNTAEDIVFSRAQVVGFIREAISNYDSDAGGGRSRAALGILTTDYRRDLLKQGESSETLASFNAGGFALGLSSFTRLTLAGGDTDEGNRDPFGESYGQRRSKSGYDSRTNLFGQINSRIKFYGSFDYGNSYRNGNTNILQNEGFGSKASNFQLRKAYVSYDASRLLRGLTIDLGRKEFWWGPGQFGTTTLGDAAGGLNSLSTNFERGSYRLQGIYSPLGHGPAGGARTLYGQNLSVKIGQGGTVGLTTTILSPNDRFDPKLFLGSFTPISLYVLDRQGSLGDSTNAVVGAYAEAAVAHGARVYGEIVLDDLSFNSNNNIENRDGGLLGVQLYNPKNPAKAGVRAEYARLNNLTYLSLGGDKTFDYDYRYRNGPLGYPVTPVFPAFAGGAESLRFEAYYSPLKRLRLTAGLDFSDINSEDQAPARAGNFPTGFSRQQVYRLAAAYDLSRAFTVTARAQRIDTDQPDFVVNQASQKDHFFSLEIGRSF